MKTSTLPATIQRPQSIVKHSYNEQPASVHTHTEAGFMMAYYSEQRQAGIIDHASCVHGQHWISDEQTAEDHRHRSADWLS